MKRISYRKNIFIVMLFVIAFITYCLSGCTGENMNNTYATTPNTRHSIKSKTFNASELVYDSNTGIVFIEKYSTYNGYTYIPYPAPNGLPYRYVDGYLVEIQY